MKKNQNITKLKYVFYLSIKLLVFFFVFHSLFENYVDSMNHYIKMCVLLLQILIQRVLSLPITKQTNNNGKIVRFVEAKLLATDFFRYKLSSGRRKFNILSHLGHFFKKLKYVWMTSLSENLK